jgi:hypothetical protein
MRDLCRAAVLVAVAGGLVAWTWGGEWRWAVTGLLLAVVLSALASVGDR